MAGDWIKIEKGLTTKAEVVKMATELNIDRRHVAGLCLDFWSWVDSNMLRSCCAHVTQVSEIDDVVGHMGFGSALHNVGWVDFKKGHLTIPKYDRHNSKSAKQRALAKERMLRYRDDANVTKTSLEKRRKDIRENPPNPPLVKGGNQDKRKTKKELRKEETDRKFLEIEQRRLAEEQANEINTQPR